MSITWALGQDSMIRGTRDARRRGVILTLNRNTWRGKTLKPLNRK